MALNIYVWCNIFNKRQIWLNGKLSQRLNLLFGAFLREWWAFSVFDLIVAILWKIVDISAKDKNIGNYGYISTLINIGEYFFHKYQWSENYSKFIWMLEKILKNDKISNNTHLQVIS